MNEETAIAKWTPADFKDKVTQKIIESFADLLPKEAFDQMVEEAIKNFTKPRVVKEQYGHGERTVTSGLQDVVNEVLKVEAKKQIRTILGDSDLSSGDGSVGPQLKELVEEAAPQMLVNIMTSLVEATLQKLRDNAGY